MENISFNTGFKYPAQKESSQSRLYFRIFRVKIQNQQEENEIYQFKVYETSLFECTH